MIRLGQYTAAQQEEALQDAQRRLDLEDHKPTVELSLKQIKVMPVLFQPRERLDGKTTDTWHVKSLRHAVKVYGDIEPPTVIRLKGTGFVVVDGHHTLEAYKEAKRTTIKCEWYPGTVREAYDQSMLRNSRDKLPVTQADRMQAAWRRVLIGGWTAEQIKLVCGASLRQVGHMRKLIRVAEERNKRGAAFRTRLRQYVVEGNAGQVVEYGEEVDAKDAKPLEWLKTISWQVACAIRRNASPEEVTVTDRAAGLAKVVTNRMHGRLAEDPQVTALALKIYNEQLPKELMAVWAALETVGTEALEAARAALAKLNEKAKDRGRRAARTRARQAAEAEVAKAANARNATREPEERAAAEARYRAALEAQAKLKAAHEAQVALEAQASTEAPGDRGGNGAAPA